MEEGGFFYVCSNNFPECRPSHRCRDPVNSMLLTGWDTEELSDEPRNSESIFWVCPTRIIEGLTSIDTKASVRMETLSD